MPEKYSYLSHRGPYGELLTTRPRRVADRRHIFLWRQVKAWRTGSTPGLHVLLHVEFLRPWSGPFSLAVRPSDHQSEHGDHSICDGSM